MERSKYFNYTRPSQTQLNNTEDSKARGILRRARSNFQFGIRTGFRVTINAANNTQIDVGGGDGFTGGFYKSENLRGSPNSGERISTLTDAATGDPGYVKTVEGLGLVDYSANAKNYVCLKYVETESIPLAERYYPFTSHNTIVSEAYLAEVYTEAQWNALTTAALEQRILVGIVTAQGAGNPLSLANIQQMVQPKSHPVAGTQPSNITGVTITAVSDETLIGNGTLRFETATKKLYWTAPGDAEGVGIVMNSSGTFTLYSNDTSYWIFIEIIFAGLPAADLSDTISIESLYGRTIPMACAVDQAHRDMLGSGHTSPTNPHGTSIDDITGGTYAHAELYHVNGISGDAETDQLECSINVATDSVEIVNNGGSRNSFLIDGISYETLTGYATGIPGALAFDILPALDSGDYMIYIDSSGDPQYVKIAEYAPGGPADTQVLFSANIQIVDIHNEASGNGNIAWDNATWELTYTAPGDAAGTPVNVCPTGALPHYGYYKLYSNNEIDWVIVLVSGNLGVAANTTFAIDKNETEHPDDSILKIGVVTWNQIGELHANLRDIRRFNTADNREEVEEEHDEDGRHTKALQSQLSIAVPNSLALYARASEDIGVLGYAMTDTGVYGSAENDIGVKGVAGGDFGGSFYAAGVNGVYGTAALNYGGNFLAGANIGVRGYAVGNTGGMLTAGGNTGGYGIADNIGLYGQAGSALGAGDTGVFGTAFRVGAVGGSYGGRFEGYNIGAAGLAANDTGLFGSANSYGVYGSGVANFGGFFKAIANDATALVGWAAGGGGAEIGVHGTVAPGFGGTGVYGEAGGIGGEFTAALAAATGAAGLAGAAGATGVYGEGCLGAGGGIGVYGSGSGVGVFGKGSVVGVWGTGVTGGYFQGDGVGNLGIFISNIIRYDITRVDTNNPASAVPIDVNGTTYCIPLYTIA